MNNMSAKKQLDSISKIDEVKTILKSEVEASKKLSSINEAKNLLKTEALSKIKDILDEYGMRIVIPFDPAKNEKVYSKLKSAFLENQVSAIDIELEYKLEFKGGLNGSI